MRSITLHYADKCVTSLKNILTSFISDSLDTSSSSSYSSPVVESKEELSKQKTEKLSKEKIDKVSKERTENLSKQKANVRQSVRDAILQSVAKLNQKADT